MISFWSDIFPHLAMSFSFSTPQKRQTESHSYRFLTQSRTCPHWKAKLCHQRGKGLSLVSCALHLYQCVLTEILLPSPLEGTDGITWWSLLLVTGFANELKLRFPNFLDQWTTVNSHNSLQTIKAPCWQ